MSVLSDADLALVYPHIAAQPASIDLHLGDTLLMWPEWIVRDPRLDQSRRWTPVAKHDGSTWLLRPGRRYLIATRERVKIRRDLVGLICARSSWGRDGLAVICGPAGLCDPGYEGNPSLELSVVGSDLVIWPGAAVAQLVLHTLETPASKPYGHPDRQSKYQGDCTAQPSRLHQEATS